MFTLILLGSLLAAPGTLGAGAPDSSALRQPQAKPPARPNTPGTPAADDAKTGTVRGKVTAADSGMALKHAQVVLRSTTRYTESMSAMTDADGLFEIKGVDAGQYSATSSRPGYVLTSYFKAGSSGITVSEGQDVKDINFVLRRGGVIAGKVSDDEGLPVAGVSVQALQKYYAAGKPTFSMAGSAETDDRGVYRVYDLPAGRYYVKVGTSQSTTRFGPPPPYGTAFYPSGQVLAGAQAVVLASGGESTGINIAVSDGEFYSVSGKITDSRPGNSSNLFINAALDEWVPGAYYNAQPRPDGSFRLSNVPPGRYRMYISGGQGQSLTRTFEVGHADVEGLAIDLNSGAAIKGQLHAEGGTLPQNLRVYLYLKAAGPRNSSNSGEVDGDGNFEIPGVQSGVYTAAVYPAMGMTSRPTYFVGAVTVNSQPVPDGEIPIPDEASSLEISITLDFTGGTITGKATDPDGKPLPRTTVVLTPEDPKKRDVAGYFQLAGTDTTGSFKFQNVIPGDYQILLWPGGDAGQAQDSDVFAQVAKFAESVTVEKSGTVSKDLKLNTDLRALIQALTQ
jgi:hypothetical protein